MSIYSPGGMPDGTLIQNRDLTAVSSIRRNPVLADIFGRLGYMERQGSGLNKICDTYEKSPNFQKGMEPTFYSDYTQFTVTLPNLNYRIVSHYVAFDADKVAFDADKVAFDVDKVAFDTIVKELKVRKQTKEKIIKVFHVIGYNTPFSRKDISEIISVSLTAAGNFMQKLKEAGLIEPVKGRGKGKYQFPRR